MTESKVILLVEDNIEHAQTISDLISMQTPHHVLMADSQGALKFVQLYKPDLLLLDYLLDGITGIILYDHLHANHELEDVPAVVISAALDKCKEELKRRGLHGLKKPIDTDKLLTLIDELLAKS
jgi:CheY-like chemotaxis protein